MVTINPSDPKVKWLIRQLCNINVYKRNNGGYFTSLTSPIVLRDDEFDEETRQYIVMRTNELIDIYIQEKELVSDDKNEISIDIDDLYNFVVQNF